MSSIQRFLQAVRLLRRIGPQLRASQIDLFLAVAVNPGRSQTELARDCALTPAAVSRQVDVLGVTGRKDDIGGKAGLLCIKRDPLDDRNLACLSNARRRAICIIIGDYSK